MPITAITHVERDVGMLTTQESSSWLAGRPNLRGHSENNMAWTMSESILSFLSGFSRYHLKCTAPIQHRCMAGHCRGLAFLMNG